MGRKTLKSWGELRAAGQEAVSMLRQNSKGEIANRLADAINAYCDEAIREEESRLRNIAVFGGIGGEDFEVITK